MTSSSLVHILETEPNLEVGSDLKNIFTFVEVARYLTDGGLTHVELNLWKKMSWFEEKSSLALGSS